MLIVKNGLSVRAGDVLTLADTYGMGKGGKPMKKVGSVVIVKSKFTLSTNAKSPYRDLFYSEHLYFYSDSQKGDVHFLHLY